MAYRPLPRLSESAHCVVSDDFLTAWPEYSLFYLLYCLSFTAGKNGVEEDYFAIRNSCGSQRLALIICLQHASMSVSIR